MPRGPAKAVAFEDCVTARAPSPNRERTKNLPPAHQVFTANAPSFHRERTKRLDALVVSFTANAPRIHRERTKSDGFELQGLQLSGGLLTCEADLDTRIGGFELRWGTTLISKR